MESAPAPQLADARPRDLRADGLGQERRRRGGRAPDPGRARLRRRDAGLPRAADPDQPVRGPARRLPRPRRGRLGRGVPAARPRGGRRDPRRRPDARRRRRHRALPARGAGRARAAAAARARARASGWRASTTSSARRRRTSCSPSAIRLRRPPCTRTTAAASCARSSSRRPAASLRRARPALERRDAAPDADRRPRRSARGARAADRGSAPGRCSSAGWRRRCAERSPARSRRRPATVHGLDEVAELPREQAIEAIVDPDAPLRRLPAQVDAADPRPRARRRHPRRPRTSRRRSSTGLVAWPGEALEVARPRQRLPARRARRARVPLTPGAGASGSATTTSASARTASSRSSPPTATRPRS